MNKKKLLVIPFVENIEEIVNGISNEIQLVKGHFFNLAFCFKNNEVFLLHKDQDLKQFTNIWLSSFWELKDISYAVKLYLDHFNIPHTFVEKETSKISDYILFALNHILVPNTFFIKRKNISKYIQKVEQLCGYPMIIKDTKGSKGKHMALVKNREELLEKYNNMPKYRKFFFQKFIQNKYDWGILVLNGKVISGEKSYPKKGEYRNNSCHGAREIFVKIKNIPPAVKEMAINAANTLNLPWSRSDIVIDKNTNIPYLLEVNRYPGITSGTNEVKGAQQLIKSFLKFTD